MPDFAKGVLPVQLSHAVCLERMLLAGHKNQEWDFFDKNSVVTHIKASQP